VKPKAVDPATQRAAQEEFVNWTAQQMTRQASLWRPAGPDAGDGAAAGGTAEGVDEMVPLAPGEWPRPTPAPSSVAGVAPPQETSRTQHIANPPRGAAPSSPVPAPQRGAGSAGEISIRVGPP